MAITGNIKAIFAIKQTLAGDLSTPVDDADIKSAWTVTDGTVANQADLFYHDQRTIANGANDDLDLAGVLTDKFGSVLTFARVKALYVSAAAANVALVTIGGAPSNAWSPIFSDSSDKIVLRPGGFVLLGAPEATAYAVTAGTADQLRISHDGSDSTSVIYDIAIIGASS